VYYAQNFDIFCSMVTELDREDSFSAAILQEMVNSNELKVLETDLAYIHANFMFQHEWFTVT
jgi:hypothetical protein